MAREKVERRGELRVVVYDDARWRLLSRLRGEARRVLEALAVRGLRGIVHGSIARGDVHEGSDVDVFIPYPVPSYVVELALEQAGFNVSHKVVVQATPHSTPKAYLALDPQEKVMVSFPLAKLTRTEYEFYYFGGALDLEGLRAGRRVPGIDKRLVLIVPREYGHEERPVIGHEAEAARVVGVSLETVLERVRVLSRRDEHGRTGVFVKIELEPWESVEEAVRREARANPALRRVLLERGSPLA